MGIRQVAQRMVETPQWQYKVIQDFDKIADQLGWRNSLTGVLSDAERTKVVRFDVGNYRIRIDCTITYMIMGAVFGATERDDVQNRIEAKLAITPAAKGPMLDAQFRVAEMFVSFVNELKADGYGVYGSVYQSSGVRGMFQASNLANPKPFDLEAFEEPLRRVEEQFRHFQSVATTILKYNQ